MCKLHTVDRDASAGSESDGTDSEGSSSDEEVSDSRGSVIVNNKPVSQFSYSELLGRDDTKPSPIVGKNCNFVCILDHRACNVRALFTNPFSLFLQQRASLKSCWTLHAR